MVVMTVVVVTVVVMTVIVMVVAHGCHYFTTLASGAIPKKCILAALAPPRSYSLRTKKVILKFRAPARCQQHHVTQIKYFTGTLEIENLHSFES